MSGGFGVHVIVAVILEKKNFCVSGSGRELAD
jgi:hypothetical protein